MTKKFTGADLVLASLENLGADTVFGIPGQHALSLFESLDRSSCTYIPSRVENNAAFAADGYSRASGKPGVLFLSTGPGALTSLGAVQEAYRTCVPLIIVSSQIPSRGLGGQRKGMLHELDDQKESARNVTKQQHTVLHTSAIPRVLESAWQCATAHPAGPVWVEIPQDVLESTALESRPYGLSTHYPEPKAPASIIKYAAEILDTAQSVAIVAGGGVRRSGLTARGELVDLAERLSAPVVCTPGGNSVFPQNHPLSLGQFIEDRSITSFLEAADVVLAIGTALGEITSNYFTFQPRGRLIQIDANPRVLSSNHPSVGIAGDAGTTMSQLLEALSKLSPRKQPSTIPAIASDVDRIRDGIDERLVKEGLQSERRLLSALREGTPDDAHTFWDMTVMGYWAWNLWNAKTGEMHSAQGAGGLGFAFPAALGGAIGSGERTLAVTGDGAALYSISELGVAREYNVPVTWVIVDDGGYGVLREYMDETYGHHAATDFPGPDVSKLGEAFGIPVVSLEWEPAAQSDTESSAPHANGVDTTIERRLVRALEHTWSTEGPTIIWLKAKPNLWEIT